MTHVGTAFATTRAALVIVTLAALANLQPVTCSFCQDTSTQPLLSGLTRWDGSAYLDIARFGYEQLDRSYGAYAPLYPLLIGIVGRVFGGSTDAFIVAGILISNVALYLALRSLVALGAIRVGVDAGRRAAVFLLVFPTTVILSATYAESTFLALAVGSAIEAERGRVGRAGLLASLAAVTRPFGAVAVLPLVFRLAGERRATWRGWASAALTPLVFLAWTAYLALLDGDPLAVIRVYSAWGSAPRTPVGAFLDLFDPSIYGFPWIVLALFAIFGVLAVLSWRVVGPAYGSMSLSLLLVVALSGSLTSSTRYELAMYPAFLALGAMLSAPIPRMAWVTMSAIVALVFTAMFSLWMWIG